MVHIFLGQFIVEAREVLLQFADSSFVVRQHGQTESEVTPLTIGPDWKENAKGKVLSRKEDGVVFVSKQLRMHDTRQGKMLRVWLLKYRQVLKNYPIN